MKIMFVCHGNICRSPMAEMILKEMVRQRGIAGQFAIASSATSTEEIWGGHGNPIYPPAQEILRQHGVPCEAHHAVQLKRHDYAHYDYFLCMDQQNLRNMQRLLGNDPAHKMHMLLEYADASAPRDVADPWYSGDFGKAYADISRGCEGFLTYLEREGAI